MNPSHASGARDSIPARFVVRNRDQAGSESRAPGSGSWTGWKPVLLFLVATLAAFLSLDATPATGGSSPWKRHSIDNSSRGADGVRLGDANGDGQLDIVTGWEEGGRVRLCLNPGPAKAKAKWPGVTVGVAPSAEDAVLVDLDADGAMDVVSSCEGNTRSLFVHWAPKDKTSYLQPNAWRTEPLLPARGAMQWMFCLPLQVDGRNGIDLVAGGKGAGAQIGWFEAPPDSRALAAWQWHPLCQAGWVMSLLAHDMDGDGDVDILASDRKEANRGCFWLENPAPRFNPIDPWPSHPLGGQGREVMFLAVADLDRDGRQDVLVAVKPRQLLFLRRLASDGRAWKTHAIRLPAQAGNAKAVNVGDIDLDGKPDLIFTCEGAANGKSGVMWLSYGSTPIDSLWEPHEVSGADGIKHDLVELLDLDGDGDLDAVTCEETKNLGVIWYENPAR